MNLLTTISFFLFVSCGSVQHTDSFRKFSSKDLSMEDINTDVEKIGLLIEQSLDIFLNERTNAQKSEGINRVEFDITDKVEFKIYVPIEEMKFLEGPTTLRKRIFTQYIYELYYSSVEKLMRNNGIEVDYKLAPPIKVEYLETTK